MVIRPAGHIAGRLDIIGQIVVSDVDYRPLPQVTAIIIPQKNRDANLTL